MPINVPQRTKEEEQMQDSNSSSRRQVSPTIWSDLNRRRTTRWQRFKEAFETFNEKVENFFMWYWPHMFFLAGLGAMCWLGWQISQRPNGWQAVGHSLGETFLGW